MIYLINPSEREILTNAGDRPPLGITYIAGYLQSKGIESKIYDLNHDDENQLLKDIKYNNPEYIGISMFTTPMFNEAKNIAKKSKKISKKTKIIIGGYHPTIFPASILPFADFVVRGRGEEATLQIIKENKKPGIVEEIFLVENTVKPARDLLNMNNYNMLINNKRTGTMITSRGCVYDCIFCGKIERGYQTIPINIIKEELNELVDKYNYKNIYFLDDIFTINNNRVKEITDLIKNKNITYRITTRINLLNDDILHMLKNSGCNLISLGLESGNDEVLECMRKGFNTTQVKEKMKLIYKYEIPTKGFFMFGAPNETKEMALRTIDFAKELKNYGLTYADFYIMTPFPGSKIFAHPEDFGIKIYDKFDWDSYLEAGKNIKAKIDTKYLKRQDLEELVRLAKRGFKNG